MAKVNKNSSLSDILSVSTLSFYKNRISIYYVVSYYYKKMKFKN